MPIPSELRQGFLRTLQTIRSASAIEVIGTGLVAFVAIGIFGAGESLGLSGPRPVGAAYLTAMSSGDAIKAAALATVRPVAGRSEDESLLDLAALRAQMAHGGALRGSYRLSTQNLSGSTATIGLDRTVGGRSTHSLMVLTSDLPFLRLHPVWRVQVTPVTVTVKTPVGIGNPTVDGIPARAGSGATTSMAVLPGHHVVGATGGSLLSAIDQSVELTGDGYQPITVQAQLTAAGQRAAAAAVTAAFDRCLSQPEFPAGCPQRFFSDQFLFTTPAWSLIGDPTSDLAYSVDANGSVTATGRFQLAAASPRDLVPEGSGFKLGLAISGSGFQPGPFTQTNATFVRPPTASDSVLVAAVKAALVQCGASTVSSPPHCPQRLFQSGTNVQWAIVGDPAADARVTFDAVTGIFFVTGSIQTTVSYDNDILGFGSHYNERFNFHYRAPVVWDGTQAVVYGIKS